MLKDASRRKFDIVIAWAIDRLGRSLSDLLDTIQHLEACGVDLYLDQQAIDTTTPMGKLVFQLTGAFAEFERTMIRQRIKAGLNRAVAQGVKLGRPKIDSATEQKVREQLAKGIGILTVAKSWDRYGAAHSKGACLGITRFFVFVAEPLGGPGGGTFQFQIFIQTSTPKFGLKRFLAVEEVLAGKWGSLFELPPWKKFRQLISFSLTRDGCSSPLPFGGVL